jgi:hypothetical protein
MEFPSKQLALILDCIRGKAEWNLDAFNAALDIVRYALNTFTSKDITPIGHEDFDPETAVSTILGEHESKGVTPAIWLQLGFWLLTKILERYAK